MGSNFDHIRHLKKTIVTSTQLKMSAMLNQYNTYIHHNKKYRLSKLRKIKNFLEENTLTHSHLEKNFFKSKH